MIPHAPRRSPLYTGTGALAVYDFTFRVYDDDDIAVLTVSPAGEPSVWAKDVDYTVALNADQSSFPGGTITSLTALAAGYDLVIVGAAPYAQAVQFLAGGRYNANIHEKALDQLSIQIQQLAELVGRTLRFAVNDDGADAEVPTAAARAGKVLGFDETGAPRAVLNFSGVTQADEVQVATAGQKVFNLTAFAYSPGTNGLRVLVNGLELRDGEFTETGAATVTLAAGCDAGDEVVFAAPIPIAMGVFGSSVKYLPTGANPQVSSVQTVLSKVVKRPQDNGDVLGDATAAVQNAINALEASGAELLELHLGDMALRIDGTITNTKPIRIIGQGALDLDNARGITRPASGSWLIHNSPTGPLWRINQHTAKNCGMEKVAIFQTGHPTPGPGWAPAAKDWVIRAESMQGSVHLKQVHFHNVYDGVLCVDAARPMFEDITGQFFHRGAYFDQIYDIGKCEGFRGWTYWSEHANVLSWMQANGQLISLGRVDGLWLDRVFGFALADVLYCGPGGVAGSARVINVGGIYADFCRRAVVVDNGITHLSINSLFHLGRAWPLTPLAVVPGACAVAVTSGSNSLIQISNYYGAMCEGPSVKISGGTNNQVWIDSPVFEQYDFSASGHGPVDPGALAWGNTVYLGDTPHFVNYAGSVTPLVTRAGSALVKAPLSQQFAGGLSTNRLVAAANGTGQLATLTAEGDADVGVAVVAQTNGVVNIASTANKLAFYGGAAAAKGSLAGSRAGNAALANLITYLAARGLLTDGTTP